MPTHYDYFGKIITAPDNGCKGGKYALSLIIQTTIDFLNDLWMQPGFGLATLCAGGRVIVGKDR